MIDLGYPMHRGNRANGKKKIPVRENTGNLEILPKHREFGFCSGCKFPDFKNILKFATKISKTLL